MMYPQQNAFRSILDLSGFWDFAPDPDDVGLAEQWFRELPRDGRMTIAVPGAWNEQLAERGLMNYVGTCWYETSFTLSTNQYNTNTWLYIGAADHVANVWLNGNHVGSHFGGFVPFELALDAGLLREGLPNRITISVDSRLTMSTLPQDVDPTSPPYDDKSYDRRHLFPPTRFDFFPYGGLTRSVKAVTTSSQRIADICIEAGLDGSGSVVIETEGGSNVEVTVTDRSGVVVASPAAATIEEGKAIVRFDIDEVVPWSPSDPHLYTLNATLRDDQGRAVDGYAEQFGMREIKVDGGQVLLNGEPLFLTGFGKHEDFPVIGRGAFPAAYLKDFELMRWTGANSFRTSHYPYDEEIIRLADRLGFLVIDEVPAVSLGFWSDDLADLEPLLESHKKSVTELILRDRNHPSVVAWSIVNEANLWAEKDYQNDAGQKYFQAVYEHTKSLDASRPVISIIMAAHSDEDVALEACDIIGLNRYFGWYTEPVDLEFASQRIEDELETIFKRYGKPIVMTEFGADTVEGMHATTAQMFTEEFQSAFLLTYAEVLARKPYCAGMHVWNFADFRTPQHFRRVVLNKKGVFNRNREPKTAAFVLRDYWTALDRVHHSHKPERFGDDFLVPDIRRPVRWRYESQAKPDQADE